MKEILKVFIAAKKTICLVFVLFILAIVTLQAQEKITLMKCMEQAKAYAQVLKIQNETKEQAYQLRNQARGGLLPDIRYNYQKNMQDTVNDTFPDGADDGKFTVTQPLFRGLQKINNYRAQTNNMRKQEFLYRSINRRLIADVARMFYALSQYEADARNVAEMAELFEGRLKELRERERLGKTRHSEVLMVESAMASLLARNEEIKGNRAETAEYLGYLTGLDAAVLAINDNDPDIETAAPLEGAVSAALKRSDVEAVNSALAVQQLRVRMAQGSFLPLLDLNGAYYTQRSGSYADSKWTALLSLDMPLFQGGTRIANLKFEESLYRSFQNQKIELQREIKKEVSSLYQQLVSSLAQVRALKDAYGKAKASYELQKKDYRMGLVNNLDVIQSMTSLLDIKNSLDRAKIKSKTYSVLLDIAVEKIQ